MCAKLVIWRFEKHVRARKALVSDAFGGGENDGLPARGALGNWFTPHFLLINLRKNQTSFLYMVLN